MNFQRKKLKKKEKRKKFDKNEKKFQGKMAKKQLARYFY